MAGIKIDSCLVGIAGAHIKSFNSNGVVAIKDKEVKTDDVARAIDAAKAVAVAVIGILIYVAFRFQFKFGVAATIATFHDVLAVLGLFFIMGKEINLILITALLTIAGYSLTDTVVVFDRIRENLKTRQRSTVKISETRRSLTAGQRSLGLIGSEPKRSDMLVGWRFFGKEFLATRSRYCLQHPPAENRWTGSA